MLLPLTKGARGIFLISGIFPCKSAGRKKQKHPNHRTQAEQTDKLIGREKSGGKLGELYADDSQPKAQSIHHRQGGASVFGSDTLCH